MLPTDRISTRRPGERGFTLVEVMIASTISAAVLAGVLTAFLMMGRNGYNASNYCVMESEARRALETFGSEARMANNLTWNSVNSVTLKVVTGVSSAGVTQTRFVT